MIHVCEPMLAGNEEKYVVDCLRTNWISSGGVYLKKFEEGFSRYCGVQYGVAACNGTAALHLSLAALGIGPGDEVIVPDFSIVSTAFAVLYCGAKPVCVDSEEDTGNIDPKGIEAHVTSRTKAIIPVHMYGHPCDMDAIMKIARKHKLFVVEDVAEAHGAQYKGRRVGSFADVACFSFYSNKIITTGEGGMVLTRSKQIADRCQSLKNLSFGKKVRFRHGAIGFNYRMTNIQAAIGLAQLEQIDQMIERRRKNAQLYNQYLRGIEGLILPVERPDCINVFWMYGLRVEKSFGMSRDKLMVKLAEQGIETRTFFLGMHTQPILRKKGIALGKYPVSKQWGQTGFYLPSASNLKEDQIAFIVEKLRRLRRG